MQPAYTYKRARILEPCREPSGSDTLSVLMIIVVPNRLSTDRHSFAVVCQ
jgi:hypothetical protein